MCLTSIPFRLPTNLPPSYKPPQPRKTECPDYRWSYTHASPGPGDLISALTTLQSRQPPADRSFLRLSSFYAASDAPGAAELGPLPPHVCSLALLPGGSAAGYVPAGVRWLMEEGSPVYDLYKECPVGVFLFCVRRGEVGSSGWFGMDVLSGWL